MDEQDISQHTTDIRGVDPDSASDEQDKTVTPPNVNQQKDDDSAGKKEVHPPEASPPPGEPEEHNNTFPQAGDRSHDDSNKVTKTNEQLTVKDEDFKREETNVDPDSASDEQDKTVTPPDVNEQKDDDSAEKKEVHPPEASPPPGEPEEHNNTFPQAGDRSHDDSNKVTKTNEQLTMKDEDDDSAGKKEVHPPEASPPPGEPEEHNDTFPQAGDRSHDDSNKVTKTNEQLTMKDEDGDSAEKKEVPLPEASPSPGITKYLIAAVGIVLVAILVPYLLQPESPPPKDDVRQIDIFLRQLDKLKTQFPNQRAELWSRSKIHLLRHLQTAQPTEPVSLLLTAGVRAEQTMRCLAQGLASAFSSALNASILHIDGATKASQDSDQVKLDIDSKLQGAFEGDKPVAVIHRFEELPPGSTLIFYRYCDHENAAYKKTCLIFTVLLSEEEEIPAQNPLSTVEEMVDDHLQKKFLSGGHRVSFDRMDIDKYGGLWSRISHLILPVAAEQRVEHDGC